MKLRLIIAGIVVAVVLGGLGVFHFVVKPRMIESFMARNVPPPARVSAEVARTQNWEERITAIGTLVAIKGVELTPKVAGIVTNIQFESGDTVIEGAELVQLDDEVEQADLADSRAQLRQAILEFQRQQNLRSRDFASEARLDDARAARDSAAATVQKIRAQIADKVIKAPFSGQLGLRHVEVGQYVAPGDSLVTLQALDPIRVDFPVPEKDIDRLATGQTIRISVGAFADEIFEGEIETLDARVNQDTRTLMVRGLVPNPDKKLLPGMFADVTVLAGEPKDFVTVPRTAVSFSLYGDSVYVVKDADQAEKESAGKGESDPQVRTVERRFVRVGPTREDRVAILEGVEEGETVVTTGQLKLRPDARVVINNEAPLEPQTPRPKP